MNEDFSFIACVSLVAVSDGLKLAVAILVAVSLKLFSAILREFGQQSLI